VLSGAWQDYLILEAAAPRISGYEAQQVPALLQTRAYARALAETGPAWPDEAARDRAADAVVARQQAILGDGCRPEVHLVIGQAALLQEVGGPQVMAEQLDLLARRSAVGGAVTVQILPFDSGAHPAAGNGSLALLRVTQPPGLGVVHVGGIGGGVCLEGQHELAVYAEAFDQLCAHALTPGESALILGRLAGA
jgi:hypothetical protein